MLTFQKIEAKWQKRWEQENVFHTAEEGRKKKCYVLEMFPYPSGSGLHMGHAFNYTIGDIYARFKRMQGYNVLYPMGYDSFGLPAENAAIQECKHPREYTEHAISNFIAQQKGLGLSYDWSRMLKTSDPAYYRWNQFFFLKFLERGLVYKKKATVNWCPKCNSVLANEQVHKGMCWRHTDTGVKTKQLEQWFIRTTAYADELLDGIEGLEWPERIKAMQRNWIGKSEGTEIVFTINKRPWKIFTTRPDTLYGVTFMVISAQHQKLSELVAQKHRAEVAKFLKKGKDTKQEDRDRMDKEGVFTGSYAIHPLTKERVPIYVGNFVLAEYGSGMVMAVPAHDQRDFEFAKKYSIPMKVVITPPGKQLKGGEMKQAYGGEGILVNSGKFTTLPSEEAREKITSFLQGEKQGEKTVQYKLRDWLISRQRYWGTPIPVIYCNVCGTVPVPEEQLPVLLPEKVKFGKGNPLQTAKDFMNTTCPECGGKAKRETDTMDTFFDSSWYFLRYLDAANSATPFGRQQASLWMPVDQYIGGAEHATMHLIYARFFTKVLRDLGYLTIDEPFPRLFNQGMLHKGGHVMSKSRGNIVLPEEVSRRYGIDTARFFLVSLASPEKDREWSNKGIEGSLKFIVKVISYAKSVKKGESSQRVQHKLNKAIEGVTHNLEHFHYNLAVIKVRELFDSLEEEVAQEDLEKFIKLLSPFCPHIAEELWEMMGKTTFVSQEAWPVCDKTKINEELELIDKTTDNVVADITTIVALLKEKQGREVKKVYLYALPQEVEMLDGKEIAKRVRREIIISAVNEKGKYDPQGKAAKAKPGRPALYAE